MICNFDGVENIVGKGENAGYQHFFFFLQYPAIFFNPFTARYLKPTSFDDSK